MGAGPSMREREFMRLSLVLLSLMLMGPISLALGVCSDATAGARDGRLLGTAGTLQFEGSSGGGLVPWASIAGYGSEDQIGWAVSAQSLHADGLNLDSAAVALGVHNRYEFSLAEQRLRLDTADAAIRQDVLGFKYRLAGDLIFGEQPQWSIGLQAKRLRDDAALPAAASSRRQDVDAYLSVGRLWLNGPWQRSLLVNATLRASRAQQAGLIGYGDDWHLLPELSAALLLERRWAIGVEYRVKSQDTWIGHDDDWKDLFIGFNPNKHFAVVLAAVDLGRVTGNERSQGWYLNVQVTP